MTSYLWAFIKRHFYLIGLGNFAFFLAIAINQQSNLSSTQLPTDEKKLIDTVIAWHQNIDAVKAFTEDPKLISLTQAERFKKYNDFSGRNNSLMTEVLNSPIVRKKTSLYNELAKHSISYADYLESVKAFVASGKQISVKVPENRKEYITEYLASSHRSHSFIFFWISYASLAAAILHLLFVYRHTRKQNIGLLSQVDTFKKVISNMTEGVIVTDKYGFFTFSNESAKNIIGPVVNDIFYSSSIDVIGFHSVDGRKMIKEELPMYTALRKDLVTDQEIYVKNQLHKDGIFVSCSNGYFVDDKGVTSGSVVVLKNITTKKQLEQFWKSEKERALENSKLKSDFLASMSHEIRTPMNAVLGLTTLLKETNLNHDQKDYVMTIQRSAKSLLTLINDILDHSKIEAGKLDIVNAPFNLKTLAQDITDNFKPLVKEKNIDLKLDFTGLKHDCFNSDSNRLRQILINLIGNAIKFTKEGSVTIGMTTFGDTTKFTVSDTGSGMSAVEVSHLFQKYFQTKNGQTVGGTGLGLNICKQLVDLLNGEIGVTSEPGIGTQFWFTLPLAISESAPDTHQDSDTQLFANQFDGLVLIAEDSTVNQKVITNYLSKLGLHFVIANNGQEAVLMYQSHSPDLILMDSNMPVMNGLEATREIIKLQQHSANKKTPIVGLSADVRQDNLDESFAAGMTAFLSKPIELNKLVTLLKQHFTATQATPSQLEKIKHLIVGDQLLVEVLLTDFKAQTPALLQKMKEQCEENKFTDLYQTAHSLKSAAAELDASDLHQTLQKIELIADSPEAVAKTSELKIEINKATLLYPDCVSRIEEKIAQIKKQQRQAS